MQFHVLSPQITLRATIALLTIALLTRELKRPSVHGTSEFQLGANGHSVEAGVAADEGFKMDGSYPRQMLALVPSFDKQYHNVVFYLAGSRSVVQRRGDPSVSTSDGSNGL